MRMHLHVTVIQHDACWKGPCTRLLACIWTLVKNELTASLHLLLGSKQNFLSENISPCANRLPLPPARGSGRDCVLFCRSSLQGQKAQENRPLGTTGFSQTKKIVPVKQEAWGQPHCTRGKRQRWQSRAISFSEWQKLCCFHSPGRCIWQDQLKEQIVVYPTGRGPGRER